MREDLIRLLDEVEAEPHAPNAGSKIGDVIFAIGVMDVTGHVGPFDTGCGAQAEIAQEVI
jgi:hypothetical protein